jgi:uncharacterized lipoprotein YehR (DUF1307 family)
MKNLKTVLAIIMALIIGVCLTGCQTNKEEIGKEEKENANAQFSKWFSNVIVTQGEAGSRVTIAFELTDYARKYMTNLSALVMVNDNQINPTEMKTKEEDVLDSSGNVIGSKVLVYLYFDDAHAMDYDSLVTIFVDNDDDGYDGNHHIYYPDV